MRLLEVTLTFLLCSALTFVLGFWLAGRQRRHPHMADVMERGSHKVGTSPRHRLLLKKESALPPGFPRNCEAGLFPISQILAAAFVVSPGSSGLYAVTFSPETLAALRGGSAHFMHTMNGDRAVAVEVNGRVSEIGTIVEPGFNALRACFATASLLTGQYFLARIDTKLNVILTQVEDLRHLLDSGERAALNLATVYLRCLISAANDGRLFDEDGVEIRGHRTECLLIAERNLVALEDRMNTSASREELGVLEKFGKLAGHAAEWIDDKRATVQPSVRESDLLQEAQEFSREMIRGMVALQTSLCFEAILGAPELKSPTGMQIRSMKKRFFQLGEAFQTRLDEKREKSLKDWRYTQAGEKRTRLEEELQSLRESVEGHQEILNQLEIQWLDRSASIPSRIYVEVDDAGTPQRLFLP